jgi:hypothetical protein
MPMTIKIKGIISDPNVHFSPTGTIRRPDYNLWEYVSLQEPIYKILNGTPNSIIGRTYIPFSNTEKYIVDIRGIPEILKTEPINLSEHFREEFRAPIPTIENWTLPTRPNLDAVVPFAPEKYPPKPELKKTPTNSIFLQIISLGIHKLYCDVRHKMNATAYAKTFKAWQAECAEIDKDNKRNKEKYDSEFNEIPAVENYRHALESHERRGEQLIKELEKAKSEWRL